MARADDEQAKLAGQFKEQIVPLVEKYCGKCHGERRPKASLNLTRFADADSVARERGVWDEVKVRVENSEMPPADKPQPTADERKLLTDWVSARMGSIDCKLLNQPGRVTIRRLNRAEYRNTIRDLVGVDYQPVEDFPSDDVGNGFDNMGDVLTLSPLLMEKYLAAAEAITKQAIAASEAPAVFARWDVGELNDSAGGSQYNSGGRILASTGAVKVKQSVERDGEYVFRVRAFGQQAGPDPARMDIRVDGRTVSDATVSATESSPANYSANVALKQGTHELSAGFVNDWYEPENPDPKKRDRNLVVLEFELRGPVRAADVPKPETHKRIIFREPSNDDPAKAARAVLERFATRAYRRPARNEEVERLTKLVDLAMRNGEPFERGIQLAVQAVLVSPHFLFRVELDPRGGKTAPVHPISEFELASRLSYFLWSSMPDDELFALAKDKKLREGDQLEKQVKRMLKDPRARSLVSDFAEQWLTLRNLRNFNPDKQLFPAFDEDLRAAMLRETELFVGGVIDEDRSVLDLIDSNFTYLNERLAKHYGVPGVAGNEFRKVELHGEERGGLLGQASILAVTSNPTRTSPVKRGKWILEQLLGTPPPPPPPEVPELDNSKNAQLTGSLRQRMEQHRVNPTCAACHARMDPLGFGLENYDALGAWRDKDGSFDVDASGVLPTGQKFSGPAELKAILKEKKADFARCLAEKMLAYAIGRGLEESDHCAVDLICEALAADGYKFSRLVLAITKSDPFQKRDGKGGK